ncbi:MAG: GHMP kinase [Flavobacteriaceae bacterium]|nr:GHMP kinase [Flavobacteriaceae bacterium]
MNYYSHGKLLITGEYFVKIGVKAFALPSKFGQSLFYTPQKDKFLIWESYDEKNNIWFKTKMCCENFDTISSINEKLSKNLSKILKIVRELNPKFLLLEGAKVRTRLEFNINWGLGSSSTLISNIAEWANVNPYKLLEKTFGGSGYDIACAKSSKPIIYSLEKSIPKIVKCDFNPSFKDSLFFVYLNKKQNSMRELKKFMKSKKITKDSCKQISTITKEIVNTNKLEDFERLINEHEEITKRILGKKTIKDELFSDFNGSIKSLGAWGGDFILATGNQKNQNYFYQKGFKTIFNYSEIII